MDRFSLESFFSSRNQARKSERSVLQPGSLQHLNKGQVRTSPKKAKGRDNPFKILDEQAHLVYRVAPLADKTGVQIKTVEKKFVAAFAQVWSGMPEYDRQRILSHWRCEPERASDDVHDEPLPRPLFEIVDIGPWDASFQIQKSINDPFSFSVSLIVEQACRLRFEIARVLAQELRLATRAHWRLIHAMLTDPLTRWERYHEYFTDEEYDKNQDELEANYLPIVEQEIGSILCRWKIKASLEDGE